MSGPTKIKAVLLAGVVALGSAATWAQEGDESDGGIAGSLSGSLLVGWRSVSVGGSEGKYRQHVDLDDGARLFGLDILSQSPSPMVDRVQLRLDHLGGDPYEGIDLQLRKFGRYRFDYKRRKSTYVYDDVILPEELSSVPLVNAGDFHTWDFDRVRDTASLVIEATERAEIDFELMRYSREGDSTTTLDTQRDEFELDAPIDETLDRFSAGFSYAWDKATLILRESVQQYENTRELFLPGRSLGGDPEDATILDFYFLENPVDMDSLRHSVQLNARPNDRLIVRASAVLLNDELDFRSDEHAGGLDFAGRPFESTEEASGGVDRDSELFDVDVSWLLNRRWAVVGRVYSHSLDQDGDLLLEGEDSLSTWNIDTFGAEVGFEVALTDALTLGLGTRFEDRDVESDLLSEGDLSRHDESTEQDGYFATLGWRPSKALRVEAELEEASYDDPFTLTSPSDRSRIRVQARYNRENGFFASGVFLTQSVENDASGWNSDLDSINVRAGWRWSRLEVSGGYSNIDTDRDILQTVIAGGPILLPILFESDADFLDARFRFELSERFDIGGDLRRYENDGDFAVDRDDYRLWLEADVFEGYFARVGFRSIDYEEVERGFNDYDADLLELGVGYRF